MAEPMYLGRPVIATAYSGNMEFMNRRNSYLVKYRTINTTSVIGCIPAGTKWADADIAHAAQLMRRVYEGQDESRGIGRRAASYMRAHHTPAQVGLRALR